MTNLDLSAADKEWQLIERHNVSDHRDGVQRTQ